MRASAGGTARSRAVLYVTLLAVTFVATLGLTAALRGTPAAQAEDPIVLTLVGNGQTKQYTMTQVQALPVYTGFSGMKNSAGTITPPTPVKGVRLTDLFTEVGGITTGQSCDVIASDGYGMTMLYDEAVNGAFPVYDGTTGAKEAPTSPVAAVLIYERDGQPLDGDEGPLRLAVCQTENVDQVADGHWQVRMVSKVQLRGALPDWNVRMYGLKRRDGTRQTSILDRASYLSCAAPGCHGRTWTSTTRNVWSGVSLSYIMGRVDGGRAHGDDAFNLGLAVRGYRIKLVSASGKYVIIKSQTMLRSKRIILANKKDGVELGARYYPLRLVGPYLDSSKYLGRITRIVMLPR